jgi:acyl dehydratase
MKHYAHLADLQALVGQEIGLSDWTLVDQARIDHFAQATGDHQWIHVDPVRAAAGPFGATIAHGFLTLSLLAQFLESGFSIGDESMGVNYGLNRVRFPAPVRVGSRLRAHFRLLAFEPLPGGAQLTVEVAVELEGSPKPACVAETVSRRYTHPEPPQGVARGASAAR